MSRRFVLLACVALALLCTLVPAAVRADASRSMAVADLDDADALQTEMDQWMLDAGGDSALAEISADSEGEGEGEAETEVEAETETETETDADSESERAVRGSISRAIARPIAAAKTSIVNRMQQAVGATKDVASRVAAGVKRGGRAAQRAAARTGNAVRGSISRAGKAAIGAASRVGKAVGGAAKAVGGAVKGAAKATKGLAHKAGRAVSDLAKKGADKLKSAGSKVKKAAGKTAEKIKSAVKKATAKADAKIAKLKAQIKASAEKRKARKAEKAKKKAEKAKAKAAADAKRNSAAAVEAARLKALAEKKLAHDKKHAAQKKARDAEAARKKSTPAPHLWPRSPNGKHKQRAEMSASERSALRKHISEAKKSKADIAKLHDTHKVNKSNLKFAKGKENAAKAKAHIAKSASDAAQKGLAGFEAKAASGGEAAKLILAREQEKAKALKSAADSAQAEVDAAHLKVKAARDLTAASKKAEEDAVEDARYRGFSMLLNKIDSDVAKLDTGLFKGPKPGSIKRSDTLRAQKELERKTRAAREEFQRAQAAADRRKAAASLKKQMKALTKTAEYTSPWPVVYEGVDDSLAARQQRRIAMENIQDDLDDLGSGASIAERHIRQGHVEVKHTDAVREEFHKHQDKISTLKLIPEKFRFVE